MMKHVAPHADLPAMHMTHTQNALPVKMAAPAAARNMTGIYLGTEKSEKNQDLPKAQHGIPPLARARGIHRRPKTPTEQRRYWCSVGRNAYPPVLYGDPCAYFVGYKPHVIPCLPPMPRSRYPLMSPQRMVELLRSKEERRGFTGQSIKTKKLLRPTSPEPVPRPAPNAPPAMSPEEIAIWEITRQTTRHFTPTTNSGVTRLEYLSTEGGAPQNSQELPSPDKVAREVQRLAMTKKELVGLVECYRKVCKSNINSLQTLLPTRPPVEPNQSSGNYRYTGFAVKSYRNPNQAEIIADFPQMPRPQTVIGSNSQRPYVPSPYFFKGYQPPKTAGPSRYQGHVYSSMSGPKLERLVSSGNNLTPGVMPVPGRITPIDIGTTLERQSSPSKRSLPPPRNTPATHLFEESECGSSVLPGETKVRISLPGIDHNPETRTNTDGPPSQRDNEPSETVAPGPSEPPIEIPVDCVQCSMAATAGGSEEASGTPQDIMIGLEDEQGEQKPVEMDETDDQLAQEQLPAPPVAPAHKRRVSITERVLKTKNTEQQLASIKESAESRKRELADLLTEHAQIVQEVESMSGSPDPLTQPAADKENTFSEEASGSQ